jgi:hypothetical protein
VIHEESTVGDEARKPEAPDRDGYQRPEIIDYGTLTELTLSGAMAQSDGLMTAAS